MKLGQPNAKKTSGGGVSKTRGRTRPKLNKNAVVLMPCMFLCRVMMMISIQHIKHIKLRTKCLNNILYTKIYGRAKF